jgi:hypothetical protein
MSRQWEILDGDEVVLRSTATLPPGAAPVTHPFLSGRARSAAHEDRLRRALEAAVTIDGFLDALRADGFVVRDRT